MIAFWRRHPWLPLALLTVGFMLAWGFWLLTAIRHAPETVPTTPPSDQQHAAPR
jgi:hypothetical protein